jgi:hypothetical protein
MRTAVMTVACGLMVGVLGAADEKDKLVREVELKDVKVTPPAKSVVTKPKTIKDAEELAKVIPDKGQAAKVAEKVDFAKEKLVLFAWNGSGRDKLTASDKKTDKGVVVTFAYEEGRTRDLQQHRKLFVVPKDAEVKPPE